MTSIVLENESQNVKQYKEMYKEILLKYKTHLVIT